MLTSTSLTMKFPLIYHKLIVINIFFKDLFKSTFAKGNNNLKLRTWFNIYCNIFGWHLKFIVNLFKYNSVFEFQISSTIKI